MCTQVAVSAARRGRRHRGRRPHCSRSMRQPHNGVYPRFLNASPTPAVSPRTGRYTPRIRCPGIETPLDVDTRSLTNVRTLIHVTTCGNSGPMFNNCSEYAIIYIYNVILSFSISIRKFRGCSNVTLSNSPF